MEPDNPTQPAEVVPADPVPADQDQLTPPATPGPGVAAAAIQQEAHDRARAASEQTLAEMFPRLAAKASDEGKLKEIAEYDAETVRLVNEQMDMVSAAEERHEAAKKAAGEAKREWEAEDTKLHQLIRERRENRGKPRQRTLLDLVPEDGDTPPDVGVMPDAPPADPTESLWQQYPLANFTRFGLTEADIEKLTTGRRKKGLSPVPLATVGDMANYTAGDPSSPGSRRELVDFDGIGPSKATVIDDALERFWAWWGNTGRAEFAREMGVPLAEGSPVEPGPAVAGDGGQDPGSGHDQPAGEPGQPGVGDHGIEHHNAAVEFGYTVEQLAAHRRDRDRAGVEEVALPQPAEEEAGPPADGPDIYDLPTR